MFIAYTSWICVHACNSASTISEPHDINYTSCKTQFGLIYNFGVSVQQVEK